MLKSVSGCLVVVTALFVLSVPALAVTAHASKVIGYEPGSDYLTDWQGNEYTDTSAPVGAAPTDTGQWQGTVYNITPFNNPYSIDEVISIGIGGSLTLQLENYAMPTDGPEIGVFSYQFFGQDTDGGTTDPVNMFRPSQQAVVSVSESGSNWLDLNSGNMIEMNIPANAFNDAAATQPADYGKPFTATVSDFDGKNSLQETLDVYNGSAGGNWLDISASGLEKVGFIKFSVPGDATESFELESISLATDATGVAVPVPATAVVLLARVAYTLSRRRSS